MPTDSQVELGRLAPWLKSTGAELRVVSRKNAGKDGLRVFCVRIIKKGSRGISVEVSRDGFMNAVSVAIEKYNNLQNLSDEA